MSDLNNEQQQVLYLIKSDIDKARYFFANSGSINMFMPLKLEKYFEPEKIVIQNGNSEFWMVLTYLERISKQVPQHLQYGSELIHIIDSTVKYSKSKNKINNFYIWWFCVKILINIPNEIIKATLTVDGLKEWLFVWTEFAATTNPVTKEIGHELLGKFLNDDSMKEYSKVIIAIMTGIKAGQKGGGFTKRDEVLLAWDDYWLLEAFRTHGKIIVEKLPIEIIWLLANRLKAALEFEIKPSRIDLDVENVSYRTTVSRILNTTDETSEIVFKENTYQCTIKRFSEAQLAELKLNEDVDGNLNLSRMYAKPDTDITRFDFKVESKSEIIPTLKKSFPADIPWDKDGELNEKLEILVNYLFADYSYIWFKPLGKSSLIHLSNADEVLTALFRDLLLERVRKYPSELSLFLEKLLSQEYPFPLFKRLFLFFLNKYWGDSSIGYLKKFFEIVPYALNESDYELELQELFQAHNSKFDPTFVSELKAFISKVPEYYLNAGEKHVNFWKYKWLSPLKDNSDFKKDYLDATAKAGIQEDKPYRPESEEFEAHIYQNKSPISKDEILKKPNIELVKFLKEFKSEGSFAAMDGKPDEEGLADALRESAKENPNKFTDEFSEFQSTSSFYVRWILWGLREAWILNKELNWESIFNYCLIYLNTSRVSAEIEEDKKLWVVGGVVDLIEIGCRNDGRAFDSILFDKVEKIFDLIYPLLEKEEKPEIQNDVLSYALNTTVGRVVNTYINFSLHVARVTQKKELKWGQNKFERFFTTDKEAYIWFGCHLPQMHYLDSEYAITKTEEFSKRPSDDIEWQMFIRGYLEGSRVWDTLYELMRPHYLKVLELGVLEKDDEERFVQHVCLWYLSGREFLAEKNKNSEPSLLWKLLTEVDNPEKKKRWSEISVFFWRLHSDNVEESRKSRILEFWSWVYQNQNFVKEKLGNEYEPFLGRLGELSVYFEKINETTEQWLLLSAPYLNFHHNVSFIMEYLSWFEDEESVKRIGGIFKEILKGTTPIYEEGNIKQIVKRLYDVGLKFPDSTAFVDANEICNTYGRRGVHFLKSLWEEYQQKVK